MPSMHRGDKFFSSHCIIVSNGCLPNSHVNIVLNNNIHDIYFTCCVKSIFNFFNNINFSTSVSNKDVNGYSNIRIFVFVPNIRIRFLNSNIRIFFLSQRFFVFFFFTFSFFSSKFSNAKL